MQRFRYASVVMVFLGATTANASPVAVHLNTGIEIASGSEETVLANRSKLAIGYVHGHDRIRPELTIGGTLGRGALWSSSPVGTGTLMSGYTDYGPELQLGIRIGEGHLYDDRIYASAAVLRTRSEPMGQPTTRVATRIALGLNATGFHARSYRRARSEELAQRAAALDEDDRPMQTAWMRWLLPQQGEVGWVRDDAGNRFVFSVSWGL